MLDVQPVNRANDSQSNTAEDRFTPGDYTISRKERSGDVCATQTGKSLTASGRILFTQNQVSETQDGQGSMTER